MAAHMGLFTLVSDVLEEEDTMVWLEAAGTVLRSCDGAARASCWESCRSSTATRGWSRPNALRCAS